MTSGKTTSGWPRWRRIRNEPGVQQSSSWRMQAYEHTPSPNTALQRCALSNGVVHRTIYPVSPSGLLVHTAYSAEPACMWFTQHHSEIYSNLRQRTLKCMLFIMSWFHVSANPVATCSFLRSQIWDSMRGWKRRAACRTATSIAVILARQLVPAKHSAALSLSTKYPCKAVRDYTYNLRCFTSLVYTMHML